MKFRTAAVASACAAFALGATATSTARVVAESHISIHRDIPYFHGLVSSTNNGCVADRKVKLKRKLSGRDKVLGVDFTEHNGAWYVPFTGHFVVGRKYYAKVTLKNFSSSGTGLSCAPDKSKTITILGE